MRSGTCVKILEKKKKIGSKSVVIRIEANQNLKRVGYDSLNCNARRVRGSSLIAKVGNSEVKERIKKNQSQEMEKKVPICENKRRDLKRNRMHLRYLKSHLTKSHCSLSVLDFWTAGMISEAVKMVPKLRIVRNLESGIIRLSPIKTPSKPNPVFSNFDKVFEKIDEACDKTYSENQLLKSSLQQSIDLLNNSGS